MGCFISIEDWHVAIHENNLVVTALVVVFSNVLLDLIESFLSIESNVTNVVNIFNIENASQNYLDGFDIKNFVIYDENSLACFYLNQLKFRRSILSFSNVFVNLILNLKDHLMHLDAIVKNF